MGLCPKSNLFAPLIYINGEKFIERGPYGEYYDAPEGSGKNAVNNPMIGYVEQSEQLVKSTRNANGEVIAQIINRRLNKFDSLTWPYLSRYSVNWLKNQIAKFYCDLGYWDDESNRFITRRYYWGDFSATPCEWETVNIDGLDIKRPLWYKDVKCNLIDCGYNN